MCGIAGFVDQTLNNVQQQEGLNSMLQAIAHRGPNFRNTYFHQGVGLGHNRLSVIDLTSGGNQPKEFKDWVIVFNGEIYNYQEITQSGWGLRHAPSHIGPRLTRCKWGGRCLL